VPNSVPNKPSSNGLLPFDSLQALLKAESKAAPNDAFENETTTASATEVERPAVRVSKMPE